LERYRNRLVTRLKPTKSGSNGVHFYSIDSRSGLLKQKNDHSARVSVISDVNNINSIPSDIRAIVRDEHCLVPDLSEWMKSKGYSDACLIWFAGDRLIEGNAARLLKLLHAHNRRSFVVVNTQCVEDIPFLTVQPRIFANSASSDSCNFLIRIESDATPSMGTLVDNSWPVEPWAKLVEAISWESMNPGDGIEPLLRLWESREKLPDIIAALVLRNLVAAMFLHRETDNARRFLEAGGKLYPTYAEVPYLAALLAMRERRFSEALSLSERAKSCGVVFPGSGGESTYRSDWLLGMLAAQVGNDRVAFKHFLTGVKCNPIFEPSLTELLKLRLPHSMVESQQYEFTQAARWNPHTVTRIFEYLVTHRVFDAARRIMQTIPLDASHRESLENQLASSIEPIRTACHPTVAQNDENDSKQTIGVMFEGPFFEHSSLARVNREIACALLSFEEFDVRLEPAAAATLLPSQLPDGTRLTQAVRKRIHRLNLTIRHQWPPNLRRPPTGKLAVIVPWEYGAVPRVWINQIHQNVDELWVPSNFVREVLVRNGVDAECVIVIPNGYDPKIFSAEGPTFRPQGSRRFVFLFVGGAIRRKGIDLLLDAYKATFSEAESVTLVLLVSGSSGAYQHNSLLDDVRAAAADPMQAHVVPIFETLDDTMLASLYRGADAFVLPYRGEGFGMPLLEAMACAKPVITIAEGPARDFCESSNSFLVPARCEVVPEKPPPLGPMVSSFTWFEPDFSELCRTLRHVYENRQEAAAKGQAAAKSTRHLTWKNTTDRYAALIQRLCDRPKLTKLS
jgi:glycosyltransferase involved in cell wall biosynthesis